MNVLTEEVIASFKEAARKLTGARRRAFQAQVTLDYMDLHFPRSVSLMRPGA